MHELAALLLEELLAHRLNLSIWPRRLRQSALPRSSLSKKRSSLNLRRPEHEHGIETTQEGSIVDMAGSSKTAPRKAPGRAGAAASGKAKSAVAKGKARAAEYEEMDVDEVLLVDDDRPSRTKPIAKVSKANAVSIARLTREKESLSREVDRLRKNVDSVR